MEHNYSIRWINILLCNIIQFILQTIFVIYYYHYYHYWYH